MLHNNDGAKWRRGLKSNLPIQLGAHLGGDNPRTLLVGRVLVTRSIFLMVQRHGLERDSLFIDTITWDEYLF